VDVLFLLDRESSPVHAVKGVAVESGGTTLDPRLAEVDLRGSLHAFELEIVSEDGGPVSAPHLAFRPAGEDAAVPRRVVFESEHGTLVAAWPALDLEVRAHGFRPTQIAELRGDRRIVLERGIPVRIRLPADVELPEAPLELHIALIPKSIYRHEGERQNVYTETGTDRHWRMRWDRMLGGTFGPGRELVVRVPEPGAYVYEWSVIGKAGDESGSAQAGSGSGPTGIQVPESGIEQGLELGPDPEHFPKAVESVRDQLGL